MVESYELPWPGIRKVIIQRNYVSANNVYKLVRRKGDLKWHGLKLFGKQILLPTFYKENMYLINHGYRLKSLKEIKNTLENLEYRTLKFDEVFNVNKNTKEIEFKPYIRITYESCVKTYFFNLKEDIDKFLKNPANESINKFIECMKNNYYY